MSGYKIVTDATVDLTPAWAERIGVDIIPMECQLDGAPYSFGPGGNISGEEFFAGMRQGKTGSTSQINPTVYESHFERFLSQGLDVVYLCFSSGLSGTIQAARICMEELREKYPDRKIACIDTLSASNGEGFLVNEAAAQQAAGLDFDTLVAWVEENKLKVAHWFTVEDLHHLHRGGRVSAATAIMGSALQIKPVMHCDNEGHLTNTAKVRGRKKSLLALVDRMDASWTPEKGKRAFICHGDCMEDAKFMEAAILERHSDAEITIFHMGPIIGAHSGPGVIALFFWGSER